MDLHIYDSRLNELGIADEFKSIIWTRRFYDVGAFEIQAPMTANNIALFQKNRYVYRPDVKEAGFIRSITEQRQGDEELLIVSGAMLEGLLDKRTITYEGYSSSLYDTIKFYTCVEIFEKAKYSYIIPGFTVDSDGNDCTDNLGEDSFGKNLGDYARTLARSYEKGIKVFFNEEEKKIHCALVSGINRSDDQDIIPQVIFSDEYGNISDTVYSYSEEGCYNIVEGHAECREDGVIGDASKAYMLTYVIGGDSYSGDEKKLNGIELTNFFITADAIVNEETRYDSEGNPYTVKVLDYEATNKKLASLCRQHYCPYTEAFEGNISGDGYRTEWQVGDYVTVQDTARGVSYKKQVEEVSEAFEGDSVSVTVILGAALKTLIDSIKEAKK